MILGIDIGGSGIKGALVDLEVGSLTTDRYKLSTPQPATPLAVCGTLQELVMHFSYEGPVGCTFPAIVKNGVTWSAANVDEGWVGTDAAGLFSDTLGMPVTLVNDADAAGVAEVAHGAAKDRKGVVMIITLGTGVGSALVVDGQLVPNTELGHLEFKGHESAEDYMAARVRDDSKLSWSTWGKRVGAYLQHVERLFSPDLFVIGGGVSRKFERFAGYLKVNAEVVPARFENQAGIIGAAIQADLSRR